jgi:hypothetical protein
MLLLALVLALVLWVWLALWLVTSTSVTLTDLLEFELIMDRKNDVGLVERVQGFLGVLV